jgi:predicted nucleic acid-binding protein
MLAILDANIAVALFIPLPYSAAAEKAVGKATSLSAPDLIIPETANALWKLVRTDMTMIFHARKSLQQLPSLFDHITASADLAHDALMLALEHNHPVYDCLYLQAARHTDATLITADSRLRKLAEKTNTPVLFAAA